MWTDPGYTAGDVKRCIKVDCEKTTSRDGSATIYSTTGELNRVDEKSVQARKHACGSGDSSMIVEFAAVPVIFRADPEQADINAILPDV